MGGKILNLILTTSDQFDFFVMYASFFWLSFLRHTRMHECRSVEIIISIWSLYYSSSSLSNARKPTSTRIYILCKELNWTQFLTKTYKLTERLLTSPMIVSAGLCHPLPHDSSWSQIHPAYEADSAPHHPWIHTFCMETMTTCTRHPPQNSSTTQHRLMQSSDMGGSPVPPATSHFRRRRVAYGGVESPENSQREDRHGCSVWWWWQLPQEQGGLP